MAKEVDLQDLGEGDVGRSLLGGQSIKVFWAGVSEE